MMKMKSLDLICLILEIQKGQDPSGIHLLELVELDVTA
jgi:hypothetical protein